MGVPYKGFVRLVVLMILAVGLAASVRGQDLGERNAAPAEGVAGKATQTSDAADVDSAASGHLRPLEERETLTGRYFGLGRTLADAGIESSLDLWMLYQALVDGGLDSDDGTSGFYYFSNHFDLEKLVGLKGASVFARVDGSWDNGINEAVGALVPVNALTYGDHAIGITQLWFEQTLLDKRLRIRIGKEDVSQNSFDFHGQSVSFDAMAYANFQGTQFVHQGLVNNASIPFPESGPGAVVLFEPVDRIYVAGAGVSTSSENFTLFGSGDFDKWMFLGEAGFVAQPGGLAGQYYAGYWNADFEDAPSAKGIYLGMAQSLYREPGRKEQGLGVFARYGHGNDQAIENFWSVGLQYQGLFQGRDRDIFAIGWAQSFTTGGEFDKPSEGALESYYRARLTPWFHVSPHVQYIVNPGSSDVENALTLGVRAQVAF